MNKRIKLLILFMLFTLPGIFAQTVEIEKKFNQFQGPVTVSVYMSDFTGANGNVGAIALEIFIDPVLLNFIGSGNYLFPGMEVNFDANDNKVKIGYFSATPANILNSKLLDLNFYYQGGAITPLTFDLDECQIANTNLGTISSSFVNGFVSPSATGYVGKLSIPSVDAMIGTQVTLPVQIQELVVGGLNTINSITMILNYDATKLQYIEITNNTYGFILTGQTAGSVTLNWSSTTAVNMAGPLTLFNIRFNMIGAGASEVAFAAGTTVTKGAVPQYILAEGSQVLSANARVRVFLEGFYTGSGQMRKAQGLSGVVLVNQFPGTVADKLTVELHTPGNYGVTPLVFANLNLNQDGYAYFVATGLTLTSYYVTVKHRNHIETVSILPVDFSKVPVTYDFTTAANKAYGNNQKDLLDGNFAIFAGDVNQDGFVTGGDRSAVNTAVIEIAKGYLVTDINGDGNVTGTDRSKVNTNVIDIRARIVP